MDRSKKVIFLSNCILNQNVVVSPLARSRGAYSEIIKTLMDYGVGIHQLPCPEFKYLGIQRKPMTRSEYDRLEYRHLSRGIALDMADVIEEYLEHDYKVLGLIGINRSPSCGIRGELGITIEEILKVMKERKIDLKTIDLPTDYRDGQTEIAFIKELKFFIEENI